MRRQDAKRGKRGGDVGVRELAQRPCVLEMMFTCVGPEGEARRPERTAGGAPEAWEWASRLL